MAWSLVACDVNGTPLYEGVQASQRKVRMPLDASRTASFQLRRDNPLATYIRQNVELTLVKVYDDAPGTKTLRLVGPVIGYQKQSGDGGGSVAVNVADVGWRLGKRLVPDTVDLHGISYPTNAATGGTLDRGAIAQTILDDVNATADTGIRVGTIIPSSQTGVGPWYFKNALQAITELAAPLDGYDWQLLPSEPTTDVTGLKLATFNAAPVLGTTRPDVVWEYGDGKLNVASFTEETDAAGLLTRAYSLPPGFPDNATQGILVATVTAAEFSARGNLRYEDVIPGDFTVDALRTKLLQQHIAVRKVPRTVITFTPVRDNGTGIVPRYGSDYVEGDIVRFRAVEEGVETVNALMRIYVVDMDIDDEGHATPTLTLTNDIAASAAS